MATRTIPSRTRPARDHHDRPAHDLLGTAAGVCAADRRASSRSASSGLLNLRGLVLFALYLAGVAERARGRLRAQAHHGVRGGLPPAAARAARVPPAASDEPGAGPVGARRDLPDACRHHHPDAHGGAVVPGEFPGAAGRCRPGPRSSTAIAGYLGRGPGVSVRPDRLQLADLASRWCRAWRRARSR